MMAFQSMTSRASDPKQGAGILIRTLEQGNSVGPRPKKGDVVWVEYDGYLEDNYHNGSNSSSSGSSCQAFCSSRKTRRQSPSSSQQQQQQQHQEEHQPLQIEIGQDHVMEGWQKALPMLQLNQLAEVTIPHLYAYGESGYPPNIPPRSTLIFKMRIVQIQSSSGNKSITFKNNKSGGHQ